MTSIRRLVRASPYRLERLRQRKFDEERSQNLCLEETLVFVLGGDIPKQADLAYLN